MIGTTRGVRWVPLWRASSQQHRCPNGTGPLYRVAEDAMRAVLLFWLETVS